jgi:hypothetical protein
MYPEEIDLNSVIDQLRTSLRPGEAVGYLSGKALMRDILVHASQVSELEAEELIDTLELRGFLHFQGDSAERAEADAIWELASDPGPRG